jgi:hypothetical protein
MTGDFTLHQARELLRDALQRELASGPMIAGSIRVRRTRCGKPGCPTCAKRGGHGPYAELSSYQGGKLKQRSVSKEDVEALTAAVERAHRFDRWLRALRIVEAALVDADDSDVPLRKRWVPGSDLGFVGRVLAEIRGRAPLGGAPGASERRHTC